MFACVYVIGIGIPRYQGIPQHRSIEIESDQLPKLQIVGVLQFQSASKTSISSEELSYFFTEASYVTLIT